MNQITFLGPYGATFTHNAYSVLSKRYGAPEVNQESFVPANRNEDVLGQIIACGGYGALAMETAAQGRVDEPVESFIELLTSYDQNYPCPISITGAVRMRLSFDLMARNGVDVGDLTSVLCHTKSKGACKEKLSEMGLPVIEVDSNGEATRLVAEEDKYQNSAALGPSSASITYGLRVLQAGLEDRPAFTTFFLISPSHRLSELGERNRVVLVFEVPHKPNALASALAVLGNDGFNLIHVHSMQVGNSQYYFCAEVEVPKNRLGDFLQTRKKFVEVTSRHLVFGPFEDYQG